MGCSSIFVKPSFSSLGLSAWRWACAVPRCGSMWPRSGQRKQQTRTPRQSALGSDLLRLGYKKDTHHRRERKAEIKQKPRTRLARRGSRLKYRNSIDANAPGFPPKTKSKPSSAGSIWKGGARERADDVFFAIGIKRRRSKADFAPTWCRWRGSNPHAVARNGF